MNNNTTNKTSDTPPTQHILPQSDEWPWSLPLFVTRSRRGTPYDPRPPITSVSTFLIRLKRWLFYKE